MFPAFISRTKRRGILVCVLALLTMFKAALGIGSPLYFLHPSEINLVQVFIVTQRLCVLLNGIAVVGMVLLCFWSRRNQSWLPLQKGCGGEDPKPDPGGDEWKEDHRTNLARTKALQRPLAAAFGGQQIVEGVDL